MSAYIHDIPCDVCGKLGCAGKTAKCRKCGFYICSGHCAYGYEDMPKCAQEGCSITRHAIKARIPKDIQLTFEFKK